MYTVHLADAVSSIERIPSSKDLWVTKALKRTGEQGPSSKTTKGVCQNQTQSSLSGTNWPQLLPSGT